MRDARDRRRLRKFLQNLNPDVPEQVWKEFWEFSSNTHREIFLMSLKSLKICVTLETDMRHPLIEKPFFYAAKVLKKYIFGDSSVSNWWKFAKIHSDLLWHIRIQILKKIFRGEVSYRSLACCVFGTSILCFFPQFCVSKHHYLLS